MSTIRITLNGAEHLVTPPITLGELLARLQTGDPANPAPVATAVNGQYVARQARDDHALNDHDVVTTFEPITGG